MGESPVADERPWVIVTIAATKPALLRLTW